MQGQSQSLEIHKRQVSNGLRVLQWICNTGREHDKSSCSMKNLVFVVLYAKTWVFGKGRLFSRVWLLLASSVIAEGRLSYPAQSSNL